MKYLALTFFLSLSIATSAQFTNIFYNNEIYVDYIESVQFSHRGLSLSLPIIDLRGGRLFLEFDDREGGFKNYTYHIIHCNKDWQPSPLDEIEYIDGFNGEEIDEFAYSTNGYSDYTHYELALPNDDINWMISGNYLLVIYDQEIEVPVLTRQFIVTESSAVVTGIVSKPENSYKRNTHQELKVNIDLKNLNVRNPQEEIFLTVMQNGNTNSAFVNVQGSYTRNNNLFFDEYDQLVYPAHKEFRSADVRSLKYRSEFVHSIDQKDGVTNVLLDMGKKRSDKNFHTEPDANGGYIIQNKDTGDGDVRSEYVNVIFTLQAEREYDENVYIIGAFSDWKARDKFKMEYDFARKLYAKTIVLKQGYYDYMYALENQDGLLEMDIVEGSWFETENDYQLIAYYRAFGGEYDRVIGVRVLNSNPSN